MSGHGLSCFVSFMNLTHYLAWEVSFGLADNCKHPDKLHTQFSIEAQLHQQLSTVTDSYTGTFPETSQVALGT